MQEFVEAQVCEALHYRADPNGNNKYSKKAKMLLLHMEETYGVTIKYSRSGHEYRPPVLPHFREDGYSAETDTIYEFFGCY